MTTIPSPHIVIIGAGPAGCSTSLFLSKAKIKHTIIDKAVFPRDKICGDALSGKSVYVLNQLDPGIVETFANMPDQFIDSWGVKFVAPNGKAIDIPFKSVITNTDKPPGFIAKRFDFDYFLFKKIHTPYAHVIEGAEVSNIEKKGTNYTLTVIQNDQKSLLENVVLIIGADGDRSIVNKQLAGIKKDNKHYAAGIRTYFEGVTGKHEQNFIELHFMKELLPGYLWIFPMSNGLFNVGVDMLSSDVSKGKINLKEKLSHVIKNHPEIGPRFINAKMVGKIQGWGLPLGSKKRPLSGNGYLLTGDAGSLIDPFTGEGIGNALYSGMLASLQIQKCIQANRYDATFMKQYDIEFYNKQWDELKLSHTMQKLSKYPWLFNFVVNKANRNHTLREAISCMFEDLDMRAKLRSPSFYFNILFNNN